MAKAPDKDREEAARREAARLAKRFPSHSRQPAPVEILPTDTPEIARQKKRYPSLFTQK
jgi:hypothetical protein